MTRYRVDWYSLAEEKRLMAASPGTQVEPEEYALTRLFATERAALQYARKVAKSDNADGDWPPAVCHETEEHTPRTLATYDWDANRFEAVVE